MQGADGLLIQLMGAFRVQVDGQCVPEAAWRRRKGAALIKLLALATDHQLHREEVLETLWTTLDPGRAENNFHRTLHFVRHALDPGLPAGRQSPYLRLHGNLVVLGPEGAVHVDVAAFTSAAGVARQSQDPAQYEGALSLYVGDLLPEDRYEDWAAVRRDELRHIAQQLFRRLSRLYEERREHERAIEALLRLVEREPADEGAHADLMRLYALVGRRGEALQQYERLKDALRREVEAEPDAPTQQLYDRIRAEVLLPAAPSPRAHSDPIVRRPAGGPARPGTRPGSAVQDTTTALTNLPHQVSSFIGRDREVAEVTRLLASTRLLTLTGAGGIGKSRLASEVASRSLTHYTDGVWAVYLAALADPRLLPGAIAAALGVQGHSHRPTVETLSAVLRTKTLLLVLDNCEHMLEACAELAATLLASCPSLRIMATSRRALGITGEVAWHVPSLAVHETADPSSLSQCDAVSLFAERTCAVLPGFALTPDTVPVVLEVCRRLDGIPLAIELAAARMRVLTVEQLAARLDNCFAVLGTGSATSPSRHQTLRAAIDWSYGLLTGPERLLFRRLAVFAGGWTIEAAEAVCSAKGIEKGDVLELLSNLVEQSLVVVATQGPAMRYRLLVPVEQYAAEKLEESGELEAAHSRHRDWYLDMAERAVPHLAESEQARWLDRLKIEHDNMRAALSWSVEQGEGEKAVRLAAALWRFWHAHGHLSEGRRWLETAVERGGGDLYPARAEALTGAGVLACSQGDYGQGRSHHEAALALWRRLGDSAGVATSLDNLGRAAHYEGDLASAVMLHEDALVQRRRMGDRSGIARSMTHLGSVLRDRGEFGRAILLSDEALQIYEALGDQGGMALALNDLGRAVHEQGQWEGARAYYLKSLELWRQLQNLSGSASVLANLGRLAYEQGDLEGAACPLEDSLRLFTNLRDRWGIAGVLNHLGYVAYEERALQPAADRFAESLRLCRELRDTWGIELALEGLASVGSVAGQTSRAARLYGAAATCRTRLGVAHRLYRRAVRDRNVAVLRDALGERTFVAMWNEGQSMTLEQAITEALSLAREMALGVDEEASPSLTQREEQVVRLLASGLTNHQLAREMGIAKQTADVHVRNILRKLGCSSRHDAAAWAREHLSPTGETA